jgi:hypothetical protein
MTTGIARLLTTLDDQLGAWLDAPLTDHEAAQQSPSWQARILRHAQGLLNDLATRERRSVRDVRGTLLLCVVGVHRLFWWKVGDGAIVIRDSAGLRALGNPAEAKGEFANQTVFVDQALLADIQCGLLPSGGVLGVALMSDGGAERLVSTDGQRIAARLGQWLDAAATDTLTPDKIALAFHEPAMWERTTLDDRSIVIAALGHAG